MADKAVSFDTETWLAGPDRPAPPIVCGSAGWLESGPAIKGAIFDKHQALEIFAQILEDPDTILVGAYLQYDLLVVAVAFASLGIDVMPQIFALLEQGRGYCIQISEALNAVAEGTLGQDPRTGGVLKNPETGKKGSYSLSMCVDLVLGRQDAKANDEWRKRYKDLDGIPIEQWPPAARDYPIDDAKNTHEVALAQTGHVPKVSPDHRWDNGACLDCGSTRLSAQCLVRRPHLNLHEVANQTYSAFCLHLGDSAGMRVDQRKVDVIEDYYRKKKADAIKPFVDASIIRDDGSENQSVLKRMVALAYGCSEPCSVCNGTGEVPHPEQPTLRCPDCKGRCQPWKAGGTIKAPTVAHCATCNNAARVPHHIVKMTKCSGPEDEKTCCGTGLVLIEGVPRTDGNDVGISGDALFESGDDFLMSYGELKEDQKVLNVYVPYLRKARLCVYCNRVGDDDSPHADECITRMGVTPKWRDIRLLLKSNTVLATGRVSYRGLIQTFPRWQGFVDKVTGQYIPSLRECFVAGPPTYEYVQVPADYVLKPGEFVVQEAA